MPQVPRVQDRTSWKYRNTDCRSQALASLGSLSHSLKPPQHVKAWTPAGNSQHVNTRLCDQITWAATKRTSKTVDRFSKGFVVLAIRANRAAGDLEDSLWWGGTGGVTSKIPIFAMYKLAPPVNSNSHLGLAGM